MKVFRQNLFSIIILFFVTLFAYGQTLQMYFLIDDNALIYKLQHIDTYTGFWGKGIIGEGPYKHIVDQFVHFYPLFGVNPTPYFAVGVLLYFFAALALFIFVQSVTKNKFIALTTSAIFASGYVGSEAMFGIVNSWQTARGIIMTLITFLLFYKYIKSKNLIFYLLSVILFFFSLDTVYIRAHGLIFSLIFFDILFWPVQLKLRSIIKLISRQVPFALIHYYVYILGSPYVKGLGFFRLWTDIFSDGKILLATIPLQDIGNLFIPDKITFYIDRMISQLVRLPSEFSIGSTFAGILIIWMTIYLFLKNFKRENLLSRLLIFSLIFGISNFIVFWLRETNHTLWTAHRYFLYSFVGVALFWSISFYLFTKQFKKVNYFKSLICTVVAIYLFLGINYQKDFNEKRSLPAKRFFSTFESVVPNIPKDAVIYFNLANDSRVSSEFGSFFGGMFSEAGNLAILSNVRDYTSDFLVTYSIDEIKNLLKENKTTLNKVFTFYYSDNGLVDTTQNVRELIKDGRVMRLGAEQISSNTPFWVSGGSFITKTDLKESGGITIGENSIITILASNDTPSLAPSTFSFSMSVAPKLLPLPYETKSKSFNVDSKAKNKIFSYLISQNNFRKTAVATSASFWKDQEPKFVLDSRLETSWRGHRGFWDYIGRGITKDIEFLSVELNRTLTVNQIKWVSAQRPLVPTHYKILTSIDGKTWNLAKEVISDKTLSEGTTVVDSFSPIAARFVKMEILKTYGNDGPEIKEFEVIESRFADLDSNIVEHVRQEPFGRIDNQAQYNDALSFVKQNSVVRFYFMSSADTQQDPIRYVEIPIQVDGKMHDYQIPLPATGINWTQFSIEGFNFPAQISINSPRIIYTPVVKQ